MGSIGSRYFWLKKISWVVRYSISTNFPSSGFLVGYLPHRVAPRRPIFFLLQTKEKKFLTRTYTSVIKFKSFVSGKVIVTSEIVSAVDLSGRATLSYKLEVPTQKVGTFDTELVEEFWLGFVREAACTLHFVQLSGTNSHHIIEGAFKAAGRAFRQAVSMEVGFENEIPSTKGVL